MSIGQFDSFPSSNTANDKLGELKAIPLLCAGRHQCNSLLTSVEMSLFMPVNASLDSLEIASLPFWAFGRPVCNSKSHTSLFPPYACRINHLQVHKDFAITISFPPVIPSR